jgi:hypothetical protein
VVDALMIGQSHPSVIISGVFHPKIEVSSNDFVAS